MVFYQLALFILAESHCGLEGALYKCLFFEAGSSENPPGPTMPVVTVSETVPLRGQNQPGRVPGSAVWLSVGFPVPVW